MSDTFLFLLKIKINENMPACKMVKQVIKLKSTLISETQKNNLVKYNHRSLKYLALIQASGCFCFFFAQNGRQ
jgi:hypothetical protein